MAGLAKFEQGPMAVGEAMTGAKARAKLRLQRNLAFLGTLGNNAPFIGLFGTVIGIIHAFQGMALSGSGGIGSVSKGISEALVTTALGLGVAIPAAWLFNYFTNVLERFQVEMSNSASELVDFFIKKQGAKQSTTHAAGVRA